MKLQHFATVLISLIGSVRSQTFSPARPPSIPLACRGPYLSTWQQAGSDGGNGGFLAGQWPTFWAGAITGWAGLIRVDNTSYVWMGDPSNSNNLVNQTAFEYTSTSSVFTQNVGGKVQMTVKFLSPVYPDDYRRQSLLFSYMDVTVESLDGAEHNVQLYSDISAEWVSGNRDATAQWSFGTTPSEGGSLAYHKVWAQDQLLLSETNDQAEWGFWYWATESTSGLTFQSGEDTTVRGNFISNGALPNTNDTEFRAISDDFPVFGFAIDLGSVGSSPVSTLFTLGMTQEIAIQFASANGIVELPALWTSYFSSELEAVTFFYDDYANATATSTSLDNQISTDAMSAAGQDYLTITSLAVRQTFGAFQLTGTPEKMYLFMKEISSDGNVNTVDVIFPLHPLLMYTNPELLKLLLDPLFENQESGQYPNTYSMHDLGSSYPNATGHPLGNDEAQPLEECGNMLIMTLAYGTAGQGNTSYLAQHHAILEQWTGFLVNESLIPDNQISTDDFAGSLANQTNLALKGIIGIGAMAVVANLTGNSTGATLYTDISQSYIDQWQVLGIAHDADPPHTTLAYGMNDTHGLLYNLYGDAELGLGLVPQSVYDMQSNFYPTVVNEFGVPLDTRHNYTKGDWEMFCAAIAGSDTQNLFISKLANWINVTPTNFPYTDLYDTITGDYPGIFFKARPVVGGTFALLHLRQLASS